MDSSGNNCPDVYIFRLVYAHIFPCFVRGDALKETATRTPSAQIVVSNTHSDGEGEVLYQESTE